MAGGGTGRTAGGGGPGLPAPRDRGVLRYILLRLIVATTILASSLIIQVSTASFLPSAAFYYVILAAYAASALHFAWYAWGRFPLALLWAQVGTDLLVVSGLVYITGVAATPAYVLYLFPIIAASLLVSERGGFLAASLASIAFGLVADGTFFGVIPWFRPDQAVDLTLGGLIFTIFMAWGSFFVIAALVGRLARALGRTRRALDRAQRELIVRERLAEAGRVSAGLAHEIRNPLAAIAGSVQVLRDELRLSDEQRELMGIILKESRRVSQSIDAFLDFASPSKRAFAPIDLAGLLDETLKMMRGSGELDGAIRLAGDALGARRPYVGSAAQFKQVFWNILKNAVRAMPDGGTLTVDFREERRGVRLRFADTGVGMSEEDRARLFEPFYSGFPGGRGLGMATVRRIVDDYEGRIEVRSAPGAGTEIEIVLPPASAPPKAEAGDSAAP